MDREVGAVPSESDTAYTSMIRPKPLNRRLKIVLLLAVSQAACLAVGIWIQYRFALALADWYEQTAIAQSDVAHAAEISADARDRPISTETLREAMVASLPFAFFWIAGLQTVAAYLVLMHLQSEHTQKQTRSQEVSWATAKELVHTRDAVIFGLAKLAESRDPETGHHLDRIALYSTRLATALRNHPRYRDQVTLTFVRSIGIGSALHDIGKVGVSDAILLKPARLTIEERNKMQTHTTIGGECIRQIEQRLGNSSLLAMAREIAYCHHERWDGTGYPANLKGEEIPLAARIVAIVDVYDALSSRRIYKEAFPHEQCISIIRNEAGAHFDPYLVDVFCSIEKQVESISRRFRQAHKLDTDICRADESLDLETLSDEYLELALAEAKPAPVGSVEVSSRLT